MSHRYSQRLFYFPEGFQDQFGSKNIPTAVLDVAVSLNKRYYIISLLLKPGPLPIKNLPLNIFIHGQLVFSNAFLWHLKKKYLLFLHVFDYRWYFEKYFPYIDVDKIQNSPLLKLRIFCEKFKFNFYLANSFDLPHILEFILRRFVLKLCGL